MAARYNRRSIMMSTTVQIWSKVAAIACTVIYMASVCCAQGETWNNLCSCPGKAGSSSCDRSDISAIMTPNAHDPNSSIFSITNNCGLCTATSIVLDCEFLDGTGDGTQPVICQLNADQPLPPHGTFTLPMHVPPAAMPVLQVNFECSTA